MRSISRSYRGLLAVLALSLAIFIVIDNMVTKRTLRGDAGKMEQAVELAEKWFRVVEDVKQEKGIYSDSRTKIKFSGLIGDDFTVSTTTLGSLEAKEIAANPEFAALIVRFLSDARVDSAGRVGIILSGSFPSLSISALAAVQTLGADAVVISSLGASMYGANQGEATWIDMEKWLNERGGLNFSSELVTLGGEGDAGKGIIKEGIDLLTAAAQRNNIILYLPASLQESLSKKMKLLMETGCDLLINIGGNQSSVGACIHSSSIPNGFHTSFKTCTDNERGIIARMAEMKIPVVHLVNIKNLALKFGLLSDKGFVFSEPGELYYDKRVPKLPLIFSLVIILFSLTFISKKNCGDKR